jgi:hypothetical protein
VANGGYAIDAMLETGEVRKRVLQAIDRARRAAADHRAEADLASSRFEAFAADVAGPVFRQCANALRVEGYPFQVFTPAGSLRLASDKSGDAFIELALDTARPHVALVGRVSYTRGRDVIENERVVFEGPDLDGFGEERVLEFLLDSLPPFVAR